MKKLLLLTIFSFILLSSFSISLATEVDSLIIFGKQKLALAVNTWQEADLLGARAFFERLSNDENYPWLIHYYIALADYRLVSFCFSTNDKDKAKQFIEDGITHLKTSLEQQPDYAEAHSLLGALYGNKIAINPFLGITLGPKSGLEMERAIRLEPRNPRSYLISGCSAYFRPKLFGGGKEKARAQFERALALFDSCRVDNPIMPDWGQAEANAWLGMCQMDNKEYVAADSSFERALNINPDYGWVKYVLRPELAKKMTQDPAN